MMKIVVFTGAGISAEAGLKTFRGSEGLWETYKIEDVATPEAWERNPQLVIDFYNQRRKQVITTQPTEAHYLLADLEKKYPNMWIITQNIDDLHERAGSKNVIHLHGEIRKVRSSVDPNLIYNQEGWELKIGDTCELGSQLRPHVVWFGEEVPLMELAYEIALQADVFVVIGTSLQVYPAASLAYMISENTDKWLIDPNPSITDTSYTIIKANASEGLRMWKKIMKL
ncbi:NAD-dependent deacylase [Fischerella thermalis CCMEE 5319]|nr:NAD-dependent deacylase [Fischerella thermalis CCMEE 5319]